MLITGGFTEPCSSTAVIADGIIKLGGVTTLITSGITEQGFRHHTDRRWRQRAWCYRSVAHHWHRQASSCYLVHDSWGHLEWLWHRVDEQW